MSRDAMTTPEPIRWCDSLCRQRIERIIIALMAVGAVLHVVKHVADVNMYSRRVYEAEAASVQILETWSTEQ